MSTYLHTFVVLGIHIPKEDYEKNAEIISQWSESLEDFELFSMNLMDDSDMIFGKSLYNGA